MTTTNDIITTSGIMSDCCGAAVLNNYAGDPVCSECLECCDVIQIDNRNKKETL